MRHGGALIGEGADTCVYAPQVGCVPGTRDPAVFPAGDYISRVTNKKTYDGEETVNQQEVKKAIHRIQQKYPDKEIEKFFNVAVATCTPFFKESDLLSVPRYAGDVPKSCNAHDNKINAPGEYPEKVNFITLRQQEDVARSQRPKSEILPQLRKLFHAVAYLNNESVIHTDAHMSNIAWMGDRIVMHDWGRASVGIKGFKNFYKRYELDKARERTRMSQYAQFKGPCAIMETCPIKLSDDATSHRFMKFYDVASLAAGAERQNLLSSGVVNTFGSTMEALWKDKTVPTNQMMFKIHDAIDVLFDTNDRPVAAPVPVHEVSANSEAERWEDWIGSNRYKKVTLILRDKPDRQTKIIARVYITIGKWSIFQVDDAALSTLEGAGYPIGEKFTMNAPGIMILKSTAGHIDVLSKLLIPIILLGEKVDIQDAPLSDFTSSPDSVPPPPAIQRAGARKLNQTQRFCKCIKKVRKTVKNEKGPIAICVSSVLQTRGRTLKRFTCGKKGRVITQKAKH